MGWQALQWEHVEEPDPPMDMAFTGTGNAGPVTLTHDGSIATLVASFVWGGDYGPLVGVKDVLAGGYSAPSWDYMTSWRDTYDPTLVNVGDGRVQRQIGEGGAALGPGWMTLDVDGDLVPWDDHPNTNALITDAPGSGTATWTVDLDHLVVVGHRVVQIDAMYDWGRVVTSLIYRGSDGWISKHKTTRRRDDDD